MVSLKLQRWIVRHTFLMRALLITVFVVGVVVFATIPLYNQSTENVRKIETRRKEEKELTDKVAILSGLDSTVLEERVTILDAALPPRKDVVLYLTTIEGLSRELNLVFGGISLSPGEVTEASMSAETKKSKTDALGLHTLETDIKIVGSQENIYTFLRLIEETAPLMQIKDVKVSVLSVDSYSLGLKLGMLWAENDSSAIKGPITLFNEQEEKYFKDLDTFRKFVAPSPELTTETSLGGRRNLFDAFTPQQ